MLKVVSVSDTVVNYNGYQFLLGSVKSENIPEYPATFPVEMGVKAGQYLDDIEMDLTTAFVNNEYIDCVRIRKATIRRAGKLSKYIDLRVPGIVKKPRNVGDTCPLVGLDARPHLRFTLKSKDAYNKKVSRPAFARSVAKSIFGLKNGTFILADVTIMPDTVHGFTLYVRAYELRGGRM